ncbi:MAG: HEAT repeat domain-containing protein [Pirellulales bacterium]
MLRPICRRTARALFAALFAAGCVNSQHAAAQQSTSNVTLGDIEFTPASGLQIEQATTSELVKWPIVADWDTQGRLVVAESGGVAKPIEEHNKQLLHRIVRLVDTNNDGTFDKRIIAADKLPFPEGVLNVGNSMLVSAPPQIWKLTDKDGDGVCEEREVWYDPGTITGCANDLHGPYMGRDGWIYWCKGAFAEQIHTLTDGKTLNTKAAHIFRRKLEGGPVEAVMTGGMDNPVEMAMSHRGERFFTSTFLQHPAAGKRDGIAHAIYGGVYGKDHQVINGHKRTGDLLPITIHLGPAAPSGLMCLESPRVLSSLQAADSAEIQGTDVLVAAQFNLHKVSAHRMIPAGASFEPISFDLVRSEKIDFHPTDVIEDADGSLLVIDTGGWYNLCCPSSGIDQKVAQGGIYRISTRANKEVKNARGEDLVWIDLTTKQLMARLADPRAWVSRQASDALVAQGDGAVDVLASMAAKETLTEQTATLCVWTLIRIGSERAQAELAKLLKAESSAVRQVAAHGLSVLRSQKHAAAVIAALVEERDWAVRRALAEAAGRLSDQEAVPGLLKIAAAAAKQDRHLEHSAIFALMELNAPAETAKGLASNDNAKKRVALIVLDQINGLGQVQPHNLYSMFMLADKPTASVLGQVISSRPQWAMVLTNELVHDLHSPYTESPVHRAELVQIAAAWSDQPAMREAIGRMLTADPNKYPGDNWLNAPLEILSAMKGRPVKKEWVDAILPKLGQTEPEMQIRVADWLTGANLGEIDSDDREKIGKALEQCASKDSIAPNKLIILKLLAASPAGSICPAAALQQLVVDNFLGIDTRPANELSVESGSTTYSNEALGAAALDRIKLDESHALKLIEGLGAAQPLRLMSAVTALHRMNNAEIDGKLLDKLVELPAARTLPLEQLKALYRNRPAATKAKAENVIAALGKAPADVEAKLDELLSKLSGGDAARGFQIFRSSKAGCSACHRIGYVGGNIGPELSRIGGTRSRRALLEAIVFPSARLEQSYQSVQFLTVDGQVHVGLVTRETPESVELTTGLNRTVTIPIADIERRQSSNVSVMPAGLDQQLTMEQLADLLTLLESAR